MAVYMQQELVLLITTTPSSAPTKNAGLTIRESKIVSLTMFHHVFDRVLNSHDLHTLGDGHQPNSVV